MIPINFNDIGIQYECPKKDFEWINIIVVIRHHHYHFLTNLSMLAIPPACILSFTTKSSILVDPNELGDSSSSWPPIDDIGWTIVPPKEVVSWGF